MKRSDGYSVDSGESLRKDRDCIKVLEMNKSPHTLAGLGSHVMHMHLGDVPESVSKHCVHHQGQKSLPWCGKQLLRMANQYCTVG